MYCSDEMALILCENVNSSTFFFVDKVEAGMYDDCDVGGLSCPDKRLGKPKASVFFIAFWG